MINETSLEISEQYRQWQAVMDNRYARRNKIRYIDHLLNELELLNLSEAPAMTAKLGREVRELLESSEHPAANRQRLTIAESMEALYEIQDTLLLGSEEDEEAL